MLLDATKCGDVPAPGYDPLVVNAENIMAAPPDARYLPFAFHMQETGTVELGHLLNATVLALKPAMVLLQVSKCRTPQVRRHQERAHKHKVEHMDPDDPRLIQDKARVEYARSLDNLCDGGLQFSAANLITPYTSEILPHFTTFKKEIQSVDEARDNPQNSAD